MGDTTPGPGARAVAPLLLGVAAGIAASLALRRWWSPPAGPLVVVTRDNRFHRCRLLPPIPGFIVPGVRLVVDRSWDWAQIAAGTDPGNPLTIDAVHLSPDAELVSILSSDLFDSGVELVAADDGASFLYRTDNLFRGDFLPASFAATDADVPPFLAEAQKLYDLGIAEGGTLPPATLTARETDDINSGFTGTSWTTTGGWLVFGTLRLQIDQTGEVDDGLTSFWVEFALAGGVLALVDRGFAKDPPPLAAVVDPPVTVAAGTLLFGGRPVRLPQAIAAAGVALASGPWR